MKTPIETLIISDSNVKKRFICMKTKVFLVLFLRKLLRLRPFI